MARARALVAALPPDEVLWVDQPSDARRALGGAWTAVIVNLHGGADGDVLGQCQGLVWGGGALILRRAARASGAARLAVWPYTADDVGTRFEARLDRVSSSAAPVETVARDRTGTTEQAATVDRLVEVFLSRAPGRIALLADRGRGKSAALGLALARVHGTVRAVVTSAERSAAREVLRFAPEVPWVHPSEVDRARADVVVVDEAAQLPVPVLRRLTAAHPTARLAFATTVHGYEGTGRGFLLRFLAELPEVERLSMTTPIRWAAGDPLEAALHDVLALDAEPAPTSLVVDARPSTVEPVHLSRDVLAEDEGLLRDVFGLLVHAHYRTTPSDLHRLLDAPNLDTHVLRHRGRVVAAAWIAREGALPDAHLGERLRGHALPDTLIAHAGHPEAGGLAFVRSVRTAVHPSLRRRGLGERLVAHIHAAYTPDAFGTLFGATADLVRFRQALGYAVVRLGTARGGRTGEPAVVALRPVSARARALVQALRGELARDLPHQLDLLDGPLDDRLVAALSADLPIPAPLDAAARRAAIAGYLDGPRPYEAVAGAVVAALDTRALERLDDLDRALIVGRVVERRPWYEVARRAHVPPSTVHRALKRALRKVL